MMLPPLRLLRSSLPFAKCWPYSAASKCSPSLPEPPVEITLIKYGSAFSLPNLSKNSSINSAGKTHTVCFYMP